MENIISTKVKWLRGLAFAFLVLNYVSGFFWNRIWFFLMDTFDMSSMAASNTAQAITTSFYLIFAALMISLASSKSNRIIYIMLLAASALVIPVNMIPFNDSKMLEVVLYIIVDILMFLIPLYCLSLILQNNHFNNDIRKWITLLLIPAVFSMIVTITYNNIWKLSGLDYSELWVKRMAYSAPMYRLWYVVMNILALVSSFKLVYSPAFGGGYNPQIKGDYNPLNKYLLGSLGAGVIGIAGLSALYYLYL